MKRTAGVIGFLVAIVVVVLTIVLLHGWQLNYAATHTDTQNASALELRETVTVHFLDTDRYVEFENAQVVYSGHEKFIVTEDNQRIQIVNAEIIHSES